MDCEMYKRRMELQGHEDAKDWVLPSVVFEDGAFAADPDQLFHCCLQESEPASVRSRKLR